jgi:hypothetical protein
MESNIIILRRKNGNSGSFRTFEKPLIKLVLPRFEFVFFQKARETMKLEFYDAVMFAVNKKEKTMYVYKETRDYDNYILSKSGESGRFTNRELGLMFCDVYNITIETRVFFEL